MAAVSSPGLMALIVNGASGVLHGNPQVFQYSPSWKRYANSAFSFVEVELDADGRVDIPARSFDLLGECYLEVGVLTDRHRRLRASDVITACSFSVDGQTIEGFTGEALDVAMADLPHVRQGDGEVQLIVGPLPFFFCSGHPKQFANVFKSGATVRVELAAAFNRKDRTRTTATRTTSRASCTRRSSSTAVSGNKRQRASRSSAASPKSTRPTRPSAGIGRSSSPCRSMGS